MKLLDHMLRPGSSEPPHGQLPLPQEKGLPPLPPGSSLRLSAVGSLESSLAAPPLLHSASPKLPPTPSHANPMDSAATAATTPGSQAGSSNDRVSTSSLQTAETSAERVRAGVAPLHQHARGSEAADLDDAGPFADPGTADDLDMDSALNELDRELGACLGPVNDSCLA